MEDAAKIQSFIEDCQQSGFSQYKAARHVMSEFGLNWQKAYYRVRKFWNPPTQGRSHA